MNIQQFEWFSCLPVCFSCDDRIVTDFSGSYECGDLATNCFIWCQNHIGGPFKQTNLVTVLNSANFYTWVCLETLACIGFRRSHYWYGGDFFRLSRIIGPILVPYGSFHEIMPFCTFCLAMWKVCRISTVVVKPFVVFNICGSIFRIAVCPILAINCGNLCKAIVFL